MITSGCLPAVSKPIALASLRDGRGVGRIDAGVLGEQLVVRLAGKRRREVDRLVAPRQHERLARRADRLDDARLGEVHHRAVVAVGLVGLEHRELGIVPRADAFVAIDAAQLVDPLHAADQQPLEVQLQRDPQEQVDVERVVMRLERPGRGAAGDRVQRRPFDFDEAAAVRACRESSGRSCVRFKKPRHHAFAVRQVEIPHAAAAARDRCRP